MEGASTAAGSPAAGPADERARSQEGRDRLPRRADHRHLLDGAGLLAGGGAGDRRRAGRGAGAGGAAGQLRPDVPDRVVVLLHEPRRSGLRHVVLLDHAGDRPGRRLARRLGDLHDRHPRRRLARRRRRLLHLRPRDARLAARLEGRGDDLRDRDHPRDDGDLRDRHRAVGALPAGADLRPGRGAAAVRHRRDRARGRGGRVRPARSTRRCPGSTPSRSAAPTR